MAANRDSNYSVPLEYSVDGLRTPSVGLDMAHTSERTAVQ
jgi:hypothetical protein